MSDTPKGGKRNTRAAGRRELKELVATCDAISERKFNPFFLEVKLGVNTLRQYFPIWDTFEDQCLDVHTLNRLSEVVRLQNTQLKFQSSALYADPEFIVKKVERMSEKRLAEVFLQSWHPLAELETLTEETVSDAMDYWKSLLPIAERWKKREFVQGKQPSTVDTNDLKELGIQAEEFAKTLVSVFSDLRDAYNSSKPVDYWNFIKRANYADTVQRAYFVSFLLSYGYAKLQSEGTKLTLVPLDQPTGKAGVGTSFPIPIPRSP